MKKVLSIILSLSMLLSICAGIDFSAFALSKSGWCGENVNYSFDNSTGTLTISGNGNMYDYDVYDDYKSPFYKNKAIKSLIIESGVSNIGDEAFEKCTGLTSVTLPDSLTNIGDEAFAGCAALKSIAIPRNVSGIGYNPFMSCPSLNSITVDKNNKYIDSRDNCNAIISKRKIYDIDDYDGKKYVIYDANSLISGCKNTIIPKSVKIIASSAFYGCKSLKSITIPKSVKSIEEGAFGNCGLTSIIICKGLKSIGPYAFSGCVKLKNIYYTGTEKQFDNISQRHYTGEILPKNIKVHYNVKLPKATKLGKLKKGKNSFTAKWNKVNNVGGYQIQYSLNDRFKKSKTVKVKGNKKTSVKVKKLKSNTKYYVRIRTYKSVGSKKFYSSWSKAKTVKTK